MISKIIFLNLFTCKGTYMIDWVGRSAKWNGWVSLIQRNEMNKCRMFSTIVNECHTGVIPINFEMPMCDKTHTHMQQNSFLCVTLYSFVTQYSELIPIAILKTHSLYSLSSELIRWTHSLYLQYSELIRYTQNSFLFVTLCSELIPICNAILICMCDVANVYVWRDWCICVKWLIRVWRD